MKEENGDSSSLDRKNPLSGGALQIIEVKDSRRRETFIRLPWSLYQDDPMWVPPLLLERRAHLSPKNPYFEHATCRLWLAFRNGEPVGRISAQVDRQHLDRYQDDTGFWGMLEAEDNLETFQALLAVAESWLIEKGMKRVRGPFNLSINQECGLLVSGFDTPPSMMMGHARPYYAERIAQSGYVKERDLLAYMIEADIEHSSVWQKIMRKTQKRIQTRGLRKSEFDNELQIIFKIFNDAWAQNWGFVPFTEKEFAHLAKDLRLLVKDQLVRIAYVDGKPAAFIILLPNLNEVIRDLNGSLFPIGWVKLLWRLKVGSPKSGRILLMGVLSEYQDSMLGAALAYRMIDDVHEQGRKFGVERAELSWILEDNVRVRGIIEDCGGRVYKTYRIYSKELGVE